MTLLLVFALLTVGLTALFLGGTVVAQSYMYQEAAPRLPVRALAGGLLLGGFLTLWTYIDKNRPGQYETFFNFSAYSTAEFTEFEAVRWTVAGGKFKTEADGKKSETIVKFKRTAGGKGATFVEEGTNENFKTNTGQYMTGAIRVKAANDPEPVRYSAKVQESPGTKMETYTADRQFVEEKGDRYVNATQMGTLFVPSTKTLFVALLLNISLLLMWLVVTWPVLRYTFAHALGFTVVGTLVTMFALMPILFKYNRPEPKPAPEPVAWVTEPENGIPAGRIA
ncbi:hypothetical protein J8F10_26630 [Gemmata sp. G18]|uniref:DUF3592 domain-containing protein n=1 Tax=Gemmata palustris TaxID=2822762 RepID=A0ABS5BYT3_9BACT|nr:hypothetical protein [Gemmata palustris]MBP3958838.1 hypothetical protein [Gemmata palustris]